MIKINHIRLRSITDKRTFGTDIPLKSGLNVIQADNTSGKSTCLQAIVYALGFERALAPQLEVPLAYAMRDRIQAKKEDGVYESVAHSYVMLELENTKGDIVTIRRDVEGGNDRKLVRTWLGSSMAQPKQSEARDFFLHDQGAAVRPDGFHTFLTNFIGWELPQVPRFDGSDCPLYLETLFPMFFVEQKRGWSATQGPLPTHFRIQDLPRRVMEFILNLDAGKARRRRAELRKQISYVDQQWRAVRQTLVDGDGSQVQLSGLPQAPTAEFARDPVVQLLVYYRDEWTDIDRVASNMAERLEALEKAKPETVGEADARLREDLADNEKQEADLSARLALFRQESELALTEVQSLKNRIEFLRIDLDRNRDAKKLQELGSTIGSAAVDHTCPTCHQEVSRELLPETAGKGMGISENITFIKSQLDLYDSMLISTEDRLSRIRIGCKSIEEELAEVRAKIRGLKNDLVRPSSYPTRVELEELVRLQAKLAHWGALQERVDGSIDELCEIAAEKLKLEKELKDIGTGDLTVADAKKVEAMQSEMQMLIKEFGFASFKPSEISLSQDNFRPQVVTLDKDGEKIEKDIGFEVSASDGVRLKWAYYLALLSLSEKADINHLGLVVFDEPGQQQMKEVDLSNFLHWTARNVGERRQMIISTSESLNRVNASIGDATTNILPFAGFILQPLSKEGGPRSDEPSANF